MVVERLQSTTGLRMHGLFSDERMLTPAWKFLHYSPYSNAVVSSMIVMNAIFIGWEGLARLRLNMNGDPFPFWFTVVECIFTVWFLAEWIFRIVVERFLFIF